MSAIQVKGPSKRDVEPVGPNLPDSFRVPIESRTIGEEQWRLRKAAGLIKLLALAPRPPAALRASAKNLGTMGKG